MVTDASGPTDGYFGVDTGDAPISVDAIDQGNSEMSPPDVMDVLTRVDVMDVHDSAPEAMCGSAPPDASVCLSRPLRVLALTDSQCGTLQGTSSVASTLCQRDTSGPDELYQLHLAAPSGLALRATSGSDLVLSVRSNCADANSEVACGQDTTGTSQGFAPALRAALPAGDYVVIVDEYGGSPTGGSYVLEAAPFTAAANARCGGALAMTSGVARTQQLIATGDSNGRLCRTTDSGAELFYSVVMPAGSTADVVVNVTGGTWLPVIHVFGGCSAMPTCFGDMSATGAGPTNLLVRNTGTSTINAIIAVAAPREPSDAANQFDITVTVN
jgi:hypothetical protein